MNRKLTYTLLLLTVMALIGVPQASANDNIKGNFTTLYGVANTRIDTCVTCHTSGSNLNLYGTDLQTDASFNRNNPIQAMKNIEPKDSDTDTFINIDEIHNLTFPGNAADFPPKITSFSPATPLSDTGTPATRTFSIVLNQAVGVVTWFLDGNVQKTENSVSASNFAATTSVAVLHNVTAVAQKTGDGSVMQKWDWTVIAAQEKKFNISGFKINDTNGNGVWDSGESGLPGWNIALNCLVCGTIIATTSTDANGFYQFMDVSNGSYIVIEEVKPGWKNTSAASKPVLIAGQDIKNLNFTNQQVQPGSIAGMKFNDTNNNGIKDTGETGLANWQINLQKPDGTTVNMNTDNDGNYNFTNLAPGSFVVSETQQAGWTQTLPAAPGTYSVTLAEGQNVIGRDFGNNKTPPVVAGSIGGMKFNDTNNNGIKDTGETGLANWQINLQKPGGTTVNMNTDNNGNYNFTNLEPGTYIVSETQQAGWTRTLPAAPGTYSVTLAEGQNVIGKDFGNFRTPPAEQGSISGFKIRDMNGNGKIDTEDMGIEGWSISLVGIVGTGIDTKTIRKETTTDATGFYKFDNLPAGRYIIIEKVQKGFIPISPPVKNMQLAKGENSIDNNFLNRPVQNLVPR